MTARIRRTDQLADDRRLPARGRPGELSDYGITVADLRRTYDEWRGSAKKGDLERRYLDKPESHGKLFTSLVREHLGIKTEQKSHLTEERDELAREVSRLRALLRAHGIGPEGGPE